jgi:L-iditol 2-dehydrogenase
VFILSIIRQKWGEVLYASPSNIHKMRVAMYYRNDDVRVEEMPVPKIGPGEFLLKVMASGICGSDVLEWYRIKKAPRVLGHEATGEIVEVGKGCPYKIGQRVFVSHHVPCGECQYCKAGHETACETLHRTNFDPGGFSEYVRVPRINVEKGVYVLPDSMSYEDGTFIEPLACVVRGQRMAQVGKGQTVLILGSGIAGLLHVKLAKAKGVRAIATDINDWRLEKAREFGADAVINAKGYTTDKLKGLNDGRLADRVIICTGAVPAVKQALESVDRGGTILFFAVPKPGVDVNIPVNDFWRNEVAVLTSYGAAPRDLKEALKLIESKTIRVDDMVTHVLPLGEAQKGFKLVADAEDSIKVILKPS